MKAPDPLTATRRLLREEAVRRGARMDGDGVIVRVNTTPPPPPSRGAYLKEDQLHFFNQMLVATGDSYALERAPPNVHPGMDLEQAVQYYLEAAVDEDVLDGVAIGLGMAAQEFDTFDREAVVSAVRNFVERQRDLPSPALPTVGTGGKVPEGKGYLSTIASLEDLPEVPSLGEPTLISADFRWARNMFGAVEAVEDEDVVRQLIGLEELMEKVALAESRRVEVRDWLSKLFRERDLRAHDPDLWVALRLAADYVAGDVDKLEML